MTTAMKVTWAGINKAPNDFAPTRGLLVSQSNWIGLLDGFDEFVTGSEAIQTMV